MVGRIWLVCVVEGGERAMERFLLSIYIVVWDSNYMHVRVGSGSGSPIQYAGIEGTSLIVWSMN